MGRHRGMVALIRLESLIRDPANGQKCLVPVMDIGSGVVSNAAYATTMVEMTNSAMTDRHGLVRGPAPLRIYSLAKDPGSQTRAASIPGEAHGKHLVTACPGSQLLLPKTSDQGGRSRWRRACPSAATPPRSNPAGR